MTRTAQRSKPEAVVKIYTEQGEFVSRSRPAKDGTAVDAEVLAISTNNDLSTDAGVFSITMVARKRWDITISPNDLIIIYMKRNPKDDETKSCVFFGLVDSTEYLSTTDGNQVKRQVTVSGRSFAKAFINFEIGAVTDTGLPGASLGWLKGKINFTGQTSADIIKQLLDVLGQHVDYQFSNKKTLLQYLGLDGAQNIKNNPYITSRDGGLLSEQTFISFEGTLYNFFKSIIDEPFNQMYFEVLDGAPRLIVRETPFNEDKWKKLKLWQVEDKDVVTMQIGRNDLETYSLYSVGTSGLFDIFGSQGTLGNRPLVYEPYLKKYGIRRMHRYSNFLGNKFPSQNQPSSPENIQPNVQQTAYAADSIGSASDLSALDSLLQNQQNQNNKDIVNRAKQYATDLFNWYVKNPEFYSGTLIVRGENHYKVGDRLLLVTSDLNPDGKLEKQEIEFFIEGVAHEFINFKYWRTTLNVTRGLPNAGKDRFNLPKPKEYQGGAVGDPTLAEMQQLSYENQQMLLMQLGYVTPVGSAPTFGTGASSATQQVAQYYLNPPFRPQHNFGENRGTHIHKGEDLAAPTGTKIYALFDGTVTQNAYQAGGAGNYVVLNHPNGYVTKYFHMRDRSFLPVGAKVKAGDLIGYVGATGDATGPHLHLEVWINGVVTNPIPILEKLASGSSAGGGYV